MTKVINETAIFLSTPSARRATYEYRIFHTKLVFLSTPSARRATSFLKTSSLLISYFYPRPPRGGRQYALTSAMSGG